MFVVYYRLIVIIINIINNVSVNFFFGGIYFCGYVVVL